MTYQSVLYIVAAITLLNILAILGYRYHIWRKERDLGWHHAHAIGAEGAEHYNTYMVEQGHHIRNSVGTTFKRILVETVAQSLKPHSHKSLEERRNVLKEQAALIIKSKWGETGCGGMFSQSRLARVVELCERLNDSSPTMVDLLLVLNRIEIIAGGDADLIGQRQLALTYAYVSATILGDTNARVLTRAGRNYVGLEEIRIWVKS